MVAHDAARGPSNEAVVLAPMIEREILLRVLQGPLGGMLREIARPDSRRSQIRRAIHWIRAHYTEPFRVEPLAAMTDMSVAAFYRHFKSVTALTPIQYQKRLRLLRARWLLLFEPRHAASIASRLAMKVLHNSVVNIHAYMGCLPHEMLRGSGHRRWATAQ